MEESQLPDVVKGAKLDPDVLWKKGKREAAAYIQAECARPHRPENLDALLDSLLDPLKTIDDWESIDWCRWLMAGGCTPDEFASTGNCAMLFFLLRRNKTVSKSCLCFPFY